MKNGDIIRYLDQLEEVAQHCLRDLHQEVIKKGIKVTPSQFAVMKKLYDRGSLTVSTVAEDLQVSLSAVTALVDRLCQAGLVTRHRDELDRRMVNLELTGEGRRLTKKCDSIRYEVVSKYIGHLDDADLLQLIRINKKLLHIVRGYKSGKA